MCYNTLKTEDYSGYKIELWYDDNYDIRDCDRLGKFYTNIPRYLDPDNVQINEILDENDKVKDGYICLFVYAYIHGGVALSTSSFSDPWDSGLGGIMATTLEDAKKWGMVSTATKDDVLEILKSEVDELDAVCQGQVYGFTIYDDNDNTLDSCGGFIKDHEAAMGEARSIIDYWIQEEYKRLFAEAMNFEPMD